jgi:hypothetical protein
LILFFGAEFTQVYAKASGSRIEPAENAVRISDAERKGMPHEQPTPPPAYARSTAQPEAQTAHEHRPAAKSRPLSRGHMKENPWQLVSMIGVAFLAPILLRKAAARAAKSAVAAVRNRKLRHART